MNGTRASPAKISRPVHQGYLPRKRLFHRLDHARDYPAVWISGPAGSGKTTLVSSYIETRKIPCLWYQVDEGDADIASFFYYLGMAGARAAPRMKKNLPLLTPEHLPGLPVFTKRFFEDLFGRLKVPSLLVLDDCQKAPSDSPFFEAMREGLSRLPAGVNAFLLSRSDPHPVFARKRVHRVLEVLGWKDLRLTLEEAEGMAQMRWKSERPERNLIRDLHGYSDGWAAGLVLLMEQAKREGAGSRIPKGRSSEEIFDYFAAEIFGKLDEGMKTFLRKSSFLPKMTAGMAVKVTGIRDAPRILSYLVRHNYFTQRHPGDEPVFEYHALFREFLLEQARTALTREDLADIRKTAAALLEDAGFVEDAAGIFREAGDWEGLARLILSRARFLVMQGRNRTIMEWMDALPEDMCRNDPWLLYWRGVCSLPINPGESQTYFEKAFKNFESRRDANGVFASWSGGVMSILNEQEDFTRMDAWISAVPGLLDKYGGIPDDLIGRHFTCNVLGALGWRRPSIAIEPWGERVISIFRNATDTRLKFESAVSLFLYKLSTGNFPEAEIFISDLRNILKQPDTTPLMRFWLDWMETTFSIFQSTHDRCLRVVSDALEYAEETGVHLLDSLFVGYGALSSLHLGDLESANSYLRRMAASRDKTRPIILGLYHLVLACHALNRRELERGAFHAEESVRICRETGNVNPLCINHLLAAHAQHELNQDEKAVEHIDQARRFSIFLESPHSWLCSLSEAYFQLERNKYASAIALLKDGLKTGREHRNYGTFLWLPHFLAKVCSAALEEGIEVEYVRELIRRNRLVPNPAEPAMEQWPWPVKVYTLGRFGLLREEKPVEFSQKVQQKPLKLLKALIALGGRDVMEGQLTDVLWPEADGDLAHQSFTIALHRLRQLMCNEKTLELKDGKLTLSNRYCWVDSWAFERLIGQAQDLHRKKNAEGSGERMEKLLRKAILLYQGAFLAGEPEEAFVVSMRERLWCKFLGAVTELGKRLEEAGCWQEAASCYRKGLDVDDLAEELYRHLMACHIRQGHKAEALSVYRRCRKTLAGILGVDPSPETEALLKYLGRCPD